MKISCSKCSNHFDVVSHNSSAISVKCPSCGEQMEVSPKSSVPKKLVFSFYLFGYITIIAGLVMGTQLPSFIFALVLWTKFIVGACCFFALAEVLKLLGGILDEMRNKKAG